MRTPYLLIRLKEILAKVKQRGLCWNLKRIVSKLKENASRACQTWFEFFNDVKSNGLKCAQANLQIKRNFEQLLKDSYYHSTLRKESPYPLHAHIEVTSLCNLNCSMCPRTTMTRPQGTMKLEVFKKIIDHLKSFKLPNTLFMHFTGEPLLNKDLPEMIRYAKKSGVPWIKFNTNVVLLDKIKSRQVINSGLDCIVLAIEMSKEQQDLLRPGTDYHKITENVKRFMRIKKQMKATAPLVKLQMLVTKDNYKLKENSYKQWKNIVDVVDFHPLHTVGGLVEDLGVTKLKRAHCEPIWASLVFLWNGDVVPCCLNHDGSLKLGNILEQSLDQIWNNNFLEELRKDDRAGIYRNPVCKRCMNQGLEY